MGWKYWGVTAEKYRVSLGDDKNVLKSIVMMVVQLYTHNKTTELHTLNGQSVWYMNYISELFKKK